MGRPHHVRQTLERPQLGNPRAPPEYDRSSSGGRSAAADQPATKFPQRRRSACGPIRILRHLRHLRHRVIPYEPRRTNRADHRGFCVIFVIVCFQTKPRRTFHVQTIKSPASSASLACVICVIASRETDPGELSTRRPSRVVRHRSPLGQRAGGVTPVEPRPISGLAQSFG